MRTTPLLVTLALGLWACPSPPDQQAGPSGGPPPGEGQGAVEGGAPDGGDGVVEEQGPGPSDGMAEPLELGSAEQTQDQVAAGEHFTVSGEVKGNCAGSVRIDVVGGEGDPTQEGDPTAATNAQDEVDPDGAAVSLLTYTSLNAPGPFSINIPKGNYDMVEVVALCDVNGDGVITGGVDVISGPEDASGLTEDTSGVVLTLSALPVPVAPEEGAPPENPEGDQRGAAPSSEPMPGEGVPTEGGQEPPGPSPQGSAPAGAMEGGEAPPMGAPPEGTPPEGLPPQ